MWKLSYQKYFHERCIAYSNKMYHFVGDTIYLGFCMYNCPCLSWSKYRVYKSLKIYTPLQ